MGNNDWERTWFENNYKSAWDIQNDVFRRMSYIMMIDGFAQAMDGYKVSNNKECFCKFVLRYSDLSDELKHICPATLFYDYKDKYMLPTPHIFDRTYNYTDLHLANEADMLLECLPEDKREYARKRHMYVSLLYQQRNKMVHELIIPGQIWKLSTSIPQVSSEQFFYLDEEGKGVKFTAAFLNIPDQFIADLTWNTIDNYFNECDDLGVKIRARNYLYRKSCFSWYD